MGVRIAILSILIEFTRTLVLAGESLPDWDILQSRNSCFEFLQTNHERIANLTNISSMGNSRIVGLVVNEPTTVDWGSRGRQLTNVVCLRIKTAATELPLALFSEIASYQQLEYLHLQCREATTVPSSLNLLTNLHHLRYLGIEAQAATNFNGEIYGIGTLKELFLSVGPAKLPDGIAKLRELRKVTIHRLGSKSTAILPVDISTSPIKYLEIGNVPDLEKMLPILPPDLTELIAIRCKLERIPDAWLKASNLEVVNLADNRLDRFPIELLALPNLKLLGLDGNSITNIPHIQIAGSRKIKISFIDNPIKDSAPENEPLERHGVIENWH
jgi:Leucine-rich repeat (LRR) protein